MRSVESFPSVSVYKWESRGRPRWGAGDSRAVVEEVVEVRKEGREKGEEDAGAFCLRLKDMLERDIH